MSRPHLFVALILPLLFLSFNSLAGDDNIHARNASLVSAETVCNSTADPAFCLSALPDPKAAGNVRHFGRYFVRKSLSRALRFLSLVDERLLIVQGHLTAREAHALEDCRHVSAMNVEFLLKSSKAVDDKAGELPAHEVDDVRTLLSAVLTNQATCSDGLQWAAAGSRINGGLLVRLSEDTKLHSASLALFSKGWSSRKGEAAMGYSESTLKPLRLSQVSLNMSSLTRAFYASLSKGYVLAAGRNKVVSIRDVVVVNKDGSGNFTSINAAVAVAPNNVDGSYGYFLIYITAGVYHEYVYVNSNKKNLMMVGAGINRTVITGDRNDHDGWSIFSSPTFIVEAPHFIAMDMTFRNTAGPKKEQAVAVRNSADQSTFYRCSFEGYQDTLFTDKLRQLYKECDIYGTVDFIFGDANAVFENCNIYPRSPNKGQYNTITAQGRADPGVDSGMYFRYCTIRAADDLASSNYSVETYLGRPWKVFSRTVYMHTFMDSLIHPAGWHNWDGDFALSTLYYAGTQ
ncbi:probable pectinesterase/pectinesterase inhibitor 41 [Rhodamnia argentea]|uniref:Pectinesterase n=1 Tax=Rhodamnia argentea TaxID=178133 RepID=A0A8B8Q7Y0_9MYRT|nr:probable pectinesterase/pectinesterase inhibitor 41 [Rhodamnia argentea]